MPIRAQLRVQAGALAQGMEQGLALCEPRTLAGASCEVSPPVVDPSCLRSGPAENADKVMSRGEQLAKSILIGPNPGTSFGQGEIDVDISLLSKQGYCPCLTQQGMIEACAETDSLGAA